jgi:hypothetical protein
VSAPSFSYETLLTRLVAGDIFHAKGTTGSGRKSLICIVLDVTEQAIRGRTVTHELTIDFDRRTGHGLWRDERQPGSPLECRIDSIEPLPVEVHAVLMGLDRKMRLTLDLARYGLSQAEQAALDFVYDFYPRHPIAAGG